MTQRVGLFVVSFREIKYTINRKSRTKKDLQRDAKKLGMTKDLMISMFLKKEPKNGIYTVRGETCIFLEENGNCILCP